MISIRHLYGPIAILAVVGVGLYSEALTSTIQPRPDALTKAGAALSYGLSMRSRKQAPNR